MKLQPMDYALEHLHYHPLPIYVSMHEREMYPHVIRYLGLDIPFPIPVDLNEEPIETSIGIHFRDFTVFKRRPFHNISENPFIACGPVWACNSFGTPIKGYIQPFQSLPFRYAMRYVPDHERYILLEQLENCNTYRVAVAFLPSPVKFKGKRTRYICIL